MNIEHSQTLIFIKDTFEILAKLEDMDNYCLRTKITFSEPHRHKEFYDICKSWDIYTPSLMLANNYISIDLSPKNPRAYEYYLFMSLVLDYFKGNFKTKETK